MDKTDKMNVIQKYINPLLQPSNKIQIEAQSNAKIREALTRL